MSFRVNCAGCNAPITPPFWQQGGLPFCSPECVALVRAKAKNTKDVFTIQKDFLVAELQKIQVPLFNYVNIDHMTEEYKKVLDELDRMTQVALRYAKEDKVFQHNEKCIRELRDRRGFEEIK